MLEPVKPFAHNSPAWLPNSFCGRGAVAVHAPQHSIDVIRVVGRGLVVDDPVRLCKGRLRERFQNRDSRSDGERRRDPLQQAVAAAQGDPGNRTDDVTGGRALGFGDAGLELNQHFVRHEIVSLCARSTRAAYRLRAPRRSRMRMTWMRTTTR